MSDRPKTLDELKTLLKAADDARMPMYALQPPPTRGPYVSVPFLSRAQGDLATALVRHARWLINEAWQLSKIRETHPHAGAFVLVVEGPHAPEYLAQVDRASNADKRASDARRECSRVREALREVAPDHPLFREDDE